MLEVTALGWTLTIAVIVALLALDLTLGVLRPHAVGFREAAAWSVFYIAVAVAFGVGFPAVFFLLTMVGLWELGTAFTVAKWSGLGLIGFYGYWAARFAGAGVAGAVVRGAAVALVGAGLIVVKALLH